MAITISGTTGISGVDGSAGTPAVQGTDTNTGVFYPAADTVGVSTGGSERVRVDSSGNVGIGTSSPTGTLHIASSSPTILIQDTNGATTAATGYIDFIDSSASRIGYIGYASTLNSDLDINVTQNANIDFLTNNTRQMSLTSTGLLQFNSGYGSVATAYGCRAWVDFNGTGTVAIRASGNVTSITDNGTGDYTVNFTTAMSDANYSVGSSCSQTITDNTSRAMSCAVNTNTTPTASLVRMLCGYVQNSNSGAADPVYVNVQIFR